MTALTARARLRREHVACRANRPILHRIKNQCLTLSTSTSTVTAGTFTRSIYWVSGVSRRAAA